MAAYRFHLLIMTDNTTRNAVAIPGKYNTFEEADAAAAVIAAHLRDGLKVLVEELSGSAARKYGR